MCVLRKLLRNTHYSLTMNILKKIPKWLPALVMMVSIFAFSNTPSTELPNFDAADFVIKKSAHMLGYALLALSYLHAFDGKIDKWKLIWLLAILYAASDEFHQSFVAGRGSSVIDVGIDSIGAGLGLWWAKKKSKH